MIFTEAVARAEQVVQGLPAGFNAVLLEECRSTQDEARERAGWGAPHGTMVLARRQLAGRGRRGRGWGSIEGNLHLSLVVRPGCSIAETPQLSFVAALAVADMLEALGIDPAAIALKWPNDVLVGGRKIAGILLETASAGAETAPVILGLGVNLVGYPEETRHPATALAEHGAGSTLEEAARAFARAFAARLDGWKAQGFAPIRDAWVARGFALDQIIEASDGRNRVRGRFVGLDPDGAMLIEGEGESIRVSSADWSPVTGDAS